MDTDSFLLEVREVVAETADASSDRVRRSRPSAPRRSTYKPGQFLTVGVPSRPDRARGPLLLPLHAARRAAHGHGEAHGRRLRVQLAQRQPQARRHRARAPAVRDLHAEGLDADLLLFAGGSGITPIMSIVRTALAAARDPASCCSTRTATRRRSSSPRPSPSSPPRTPTGCRWSTGSSRSRGCRARTSCASSLRRTRRGRRSAAARRRS